MNRSVIVPSRPLKVNRARSPERVLTPLSGILGTRSVGPWCTARAGVVDFVETLHGLVAVVLPALQQVVHGHGAAVVVDVVTALAVGEDLDALDEAGGVGRGRGQRVGAVRVPDAEGDLDGLGVDEGRAAGQRDAADRRGCGGERAPSSGSTARCAAPSRSWCCSSYVPRHAFSLVRRRSKIDWIFF